MASEVKLFVEKLYDLLDFAESRGMEHIISWCHDGLAFTVHDPGLLADTLLQLFFGTSKYASFTRQLNHWCFSRISAPSSARNTPGTFEHPFFIRGNKNICKNLTRESFKRPPMTTVCSAIVDCKKVQSYSKKSISSHATKGAKIISSGAYFGTSTKSADSPCSIQSSPFIVGRASSKVLESKSIMNSIGRSTSDGEQTIKRNHYALEPTSVMNSIGRSKSDGEQPTKSNQNALRDGDPVEFEGRKFYFLDCGS